MTVLQGVATGVQPSAGAGIDCHNMVIHGVRPDGSYIEADALDEPQKKSVADGQLLRMVDNESVHRNIFRFNQLQTQLLFQRLEDGGQAASWS